MANTRKHNYKNLKKSTEQDFFDFYYCVSRTGIHLRHKNQTPDMSVYNLLMRELGLSAQLKREYETEINSADDYQSRLTIMQKWFVIVFMK